MSEGIKTVHFGDFCHKMENRVLITVILLVVTCGGCVGDNKETETSPQDSGSEPKDRRLLLNDPSTLLKEIEALHREMTSLKSHVTTMETEVASLNSLKTEVSTQRTLILSLESQLNSRNQPGRYIVIYRVMQKLEMNSRFQNAYFCSLNSHINHCISIGNTFYVTFD